MSDSVLRLGTLIPIKCMIGSRPVSALYSGQTQIWSPKKPAPFVKAEGDWTMDANVFTSNKISDDESTIEKVYFKNLGGKIITINYDVDSESDCDYLTIFALDSETGILAASSDDGTTNGDYGRVGSADFTFPDNEEHFICLKYSKDGSESSGRDNAIVTFPPELFGEVKWIVVGEVIRYEHENDAFYKCVYQDLQLSLNDVLTDTHKDGGLISKEPTTTTIISPDDTIKLDDVSYGFWVPEVDPNKVYNLSFNSPTSIVFGNPIKISSWNITTKYGLKEIRGLNFVDTSNVTNMSSMFNGCQSLTSMDGLSGWNVSNVTDMRNMFSNCRTLTSLDLSSWDTSKVTDMSGMFYYCGALTSLNLSGWDVSNVTNMSSMFAAVPGEGDQSSVLTSLDLSGWDTSKVTNMGSMFSSCRALASLDGLSGWDVSNVTNMSGMFHSCDTLTSLDLSGWDVSNVTNMSSMFNGCGATSLDLSGWDTSKVTNMGYMFYWCNSLTSLNVSGWDVSNVTDMSYMFYHCDKLAPLNVSGWDVSNTTNMSRMFNFCRALTSLDLSGWNTSKVTNMSEMFYYCDSLTSLNVSGWDTSKVTNMSSMFNFCRALTTITGPITGISTSIDLKKSPLTHDSAMVFMNGLNTVTETRSITFKKSTYDTLTEAEIAAATAKGWTVKSA